jgi:hypothetical protein
LLFWDLRCFNSLPIGSAAHNPSPHPQRKGTAPCPQYTFLLARGVASRLAAAPISRVRSRFASHRRADLPRFRLLLHGGLVEVLLLHRRNHPLQSETGPHPDDSAATGPGPNPTTGACPNAATPAPRALQRPPPPPSQQELWCRRQGHHVLPDAAQKTRKRKASASPGANNAPPPLYNLPAAATISNNDLDASMAR